MITMHRFFVAMPLQGCWRRTTPAWAMKTAQSPLSWTRTSLYDPAPLKKSSMLLFAGRRSRFPRHGGCVTEYRWKQVKNMETGVCFLVSGVVRHSGNDAQVAVFLLSAHWASSAPTSRTLGIFVLVLTGISEYVGWFIFVTHDIHAGLECSEASGDTRIT